MLNSLKSWFGEVTTGHGAMVLSGALLSVLSGGLTWAAAAPLLAAGMVGLVWPENAALQDPGKTTATALAGAGSTYDNQGTTPPTRS